MVRPRSRSLRSAFRSGESRRQNLYARNASPSGPKGRNRRGKNITASIGRAGSALAVGGDLDGADVASDEKLFRTLILLLAACDQTTNELKQADVVVDGLGEDLEALSSRLRELLDQDRWKTPTR